MADFTPNTEKPTLKYVDRLHEIKRAICTLDESLTPSKRIGNKSIGLSPMFGTPFQKENTPRNATINLLDHQNVLTPSKTALIEENKDFSMTYSQMSVSESFIQNSEIATNVKNITSTNSLIKAFCQIYKDMAVDDVLSVISNYTEQCAELYKASRAMLSSVKHSKKLSQQIHAACGDIANERYTWKLLGAIYQNKLNMSVEEVEGEGDLNTINALYGSDENMRHIQVVLDWLESNAAELLPDLPTKVGYFSGKVSWENTFHSLCNQRNKKTVSSMDPDATTREGASLNEVDLEDQSRLIKHLFCLVRAGKPDEAQKLCISSGQCWRAAVIDGWRLYNDPNYNNVAKQRESVEGNSNRGLWKSCCWEFCNTSHIAPEERALYGTLSGNLSGILPVCGTFHDQLWAYFKVLADQRVEGELSEGTAVMPQNYWKHTLSLEDIVNIMGKTKQSDLLYNKLQLQLIAGDLSGLLNTISQHIETATISERRFLCHLLLVLEVLHTDLAPEILYDTVSKYIVSLRAEEHLPEVVYYASQLPTDRQIRLLSEVLADVDDEQRALCVELALEAGIPIEEVTMRIYHGLISQHSPSNNDIVSVANISDTDAHIIEAVSWLLLTTTQRSDALRQANRLIRRFLGARKHAPACAVFAMIPTDTIEVIHQEWNKMYENTPLDADDANAIREYLCLQAYLDTHQAYNDWCSHSANRPSSPVSKGGLTFSEQVAEEEKERAYEISLQRWEQNLNVQTQLTRDKLLNVLLFIDGGWLVDEVEGSEEGRADQLHALRCQCIPSTTALLVNVLAESGQHKAVVELSDYIASENYKLYTLFTSQELKRFLDKVYESSLACECDPLGFNESSQEPDMVA